MSFADAFCRRFGLRIEQYEEAVLWHCLVCRSSLLGRLAELVTPDFFRDERQAIQRLGEARGKIEFSDELDDLDYVTRRHGGFLRLNAGLRLSGRRLMRLQLRLFR